jgi:hypothetical protein
MQKKNTNVLWNKQHLLTPNSESLSSWSLLRWSRNFLLRDQKAHDRHHKGPALNLALSFLIFSHPTSDSRYYYSTICVCTLHLLFTQFITDNWIICPDLLVFQGRLNYNKRDMGQAGQKHTKFYFENRNGINRFKDRLQLRAFANAVMNIRIL